MRDILLKVDAGAYRSEVRHGAANTSSHPYAPSSFARCPTYPPCKVLMSYVGLGGYSLLCTETRLLHVRTSSLVMSWQVPWQRLKGCGVQPRQKAVVLQFFTDSFTGHGSKQILCGNDSALQLVYTMVQTARARHSERLVLQALTTHAAAQQLRKAVGST